MQLSIYFRRPHRSMDPDLFQSQVSNSKDTPRREDCRLSGLQFFFWQRDLVWMVTDFCSHALSTSAEDGSSRLVSFLVCTPPNILFSVW